MKTTIATVKNELRLAKIKPLLGEFFLRGSKLYQSAVKENFLKPSDIRSMRENIFTPSLKTEMFP